MNLAVAKIALAPLLIAQGVWTRRRTPVLPEAAGPRAGECGDGATLWLLVAGDSSAAGAGGRRAGQRRLPPRRGRLGAAPRRWRGT